MFSLINPAPAAGWIMAAMLIVVSESALAQAPAFVAPPRTIADITAILDRQKPDPGRHAKMQAAADQVAPAGLGPRELANSTSSARWRGASSDGSRTRMPMPSRLSRSARARSSRGDYSGFGSWLQSGIGMRASSGRPSRR